MKCSGNAAEFGEIRKGRRKRYLERLGGERERERASFGAIRRLREVEFGKTNGGKENRKGKIGVNRAMERYQINITR